MSKEITQKLYDIIPSQQTMYYMNKFSLHKSVTQIPSAVVIDGPIDFSLLNKAFNIEIERNDALRLRFVKSGEAIKQYFIDPYKIENIPVMTFKSFEEQEKFLSADAKKPVRYLKGETFRVFFFNTYDGKKGIYVNISHIVTDAVGLALLISDLLDVYKSLKMDKPLPEPLVPYEEKINKEMEYFKKEELHKKDTEFYIHYWKDYGNVFYAGIHGPDVLEKARKKDPELTVPSAFDPFRDKSKIIHRYISAEETNAIYDYCKKNRVVPENVILYGLRAHASKVNYRTDNVLSMTMCSRRATYNDKRTGGCLAQPLQIRVITKETDTFTEAVERVSACRNSLIRHMNFPYLEARALQQKAFNLSVSQGPSCFMFSWIPVGLAVDKANFEFEFKMYNIGRYVMPLYIFVIPDAVTGGTDFYYMYRTSLLKPEQVHLLHDNAMKVLKMGMENPDITVKEILDNIDGLPEGSGGRK